MKLGVYISIIIALIFSINIAIAGGDHDHHQGDDHHKTVPTQTHKEQTNHSEKDHSEHSEENKTIYLSRDTLKSNQIEVATANSHVIEQTLPVYGKIVPEQNKQVAIYPRFAGIVKSLNYQLGDNVKKGDVLAVIESNESLQNYSVKAPLTGTLIEQHVNVGKLVKSDQAMYELADLSSVWVELSIYRKDAHRVKKGDHIYVTKEGEKNKKIKSVIHYISPIGNEHTQSIIARATLSNPHNQWIPGLYVDVTIVVNKHNVPVAVTRDAIQEVDGEKVVFVEKKDHYFEAKHVTLGVGDDNFVQVKAGLKSGVRYVSKNSFILKAELEKSSAEHTH